jgi:DNA-binding NarL/FixJ family response regulator
LITASWHAGDVRANHTGAVPSDERLRCVIVDDNPDFLDAATRLLECQGARVVGVAQSRRAAMRCIPDLRPDVTLVDIDLGGDSGFDLVEELHRNGPTAATPVILISTHDGQDFADLVAASTAMAFLPKSTLSAAAIREILGS